MAGSGSGLRFRVKWLYHVPHQCNGYKKSPVNQTGGILSMVRGSGLSLIPVAVFLAILLIVLPVSADNVTTTGTTVAPANTTVTPSPTTVAPANTTVTPSPTTVATTATPATTLPATTITSLPATITANPTLSGVETIATGSVSVYSSPAGASILIDGVYSGITPQTVNAVSAGNHILRLSLSGYSDYEGSIFVVPGEMAQGYGTLQPMNKITSAAAAPVTTATIPVIVPVVTATPGPAQDTGLLGNTSVIVAIIGAITVLIVAGVSLFIHLTPPKKE